MSFTESTPIKISSLCATGECAGSLRHISVIWPVMSLLISLWATANWEREKNLYKKSTVFWSEWIIILQILIKYCRGRVSRPDDGLSRPDDGLSRPDVSNTIKNGTGDPSPTENIALLNISHKFLFFIYSLKYRNKKTWIWLDIWEQLCYNRIYYSRKFYDADEKGRSFLWKYP